MDFLTFANRVCQECVDHAAIRGVTIAVVVLDSTFSHAASMRMDGAYASAFALARSKAWTALNFGTSTAAMADRVEPARGAMIAATEPNLLFLGGGDVLSHGGIVVGAVGVSGGTAAEDIDIVARGIGSTLR
ncbi:heme-binding protein [Pseudonocardia ailaonensis]|uniref:Heme-binding protein n=1 Tax=Pseudonocardia ailaonensis TaxID=367279 RepID=A0ABN2N474_9PSEU